MSEISEPVPVPKNPKANPDCAMCDGYGKYPAMVDDDEEVVYDYTCACTKQQSHDRGVSGILNTTAWLYSLHDCPELHWQNFDALRVKNAEGIRGVLVTAIILGAWSMTWTYLNRDLGLYGI